MIGLDQTWSTVWSSMNRPFIAPAITVLAFIAAKRLQARWPDNPLLNPTLCAIALVIGFITIFNVPYEAYLANTQVINFMLAPTVVLLAVPLYRRLRLIRASWKVVAGALFAGLPAGIVSSLAIAAFFNAKPETVYALAPRSVTAGIAMGIEEVLGGIPALTAVFVISTGIFGAAFGPLLLRALRVRDHRVIGLAIGIGSHGIGTARAFQLSEEAGAFASLAMALNGIATAVVIPAFATAMHLHLKRTPFAPVVAQTSSVIERLASDVARAGSNVWAFLLDHESQLLLDLFVMLAFAGLAVLCAVGGRLLNDRGGSRRVKMTPALGRCPSRSNDVALNASSNQS